MSAKKTTKVYRVALVNSQTIGARCGHGYGKTLAEAQQNALQLAREIDPNARLSSCGTQVWFAGGVHC